MESGGRLRLEGDAANHLARVLRLKPGDPLLLFNGLGGEYEARLLETGKRHVELEIGPFHDREAESPLSITLVQAVSRGERMDYTLQKAVELGVSRIVPVFSARGMVSLDGERRERRHDHWLKIVAGACEQCGRNRLPELLEARPLCEWLRAPPHGLGLVLDHRTETGFASLPESRAVSLLVGPEGGLESGELAAAESAGYRRVKIGPRVLRTETAPLAALAILQYLWGDLR